MPIPSKIQTLLPWLQVTRETEIACDDCLASMAELLESELENRPVSEALVAVRQHLDFCSECREEYETLVAAVRTLDDCNR